MEPFQAKSAEPSASAKLPEKPSAREQSESKEGFFMGDLKKLEDFPEEE
jgi:hypothetical protein